MYTNETLYNALKKAIIAEGLANELPNEEFMCAGLLGDVMDMLKMNLREEIAKKKGAKVKHLNIIKQVLKENELFGHEKKWMKAIPYENGKYYFTNAIEAIIGNQDFGYEHLNPEDCPSLTEYIHTLCTSNLENIVKVDVDDLKLHISTHKKDKETPYIISYGTGQQAGFCPRYLLRCLQWCETDTIQISNKKFAPCVIKGDTGNMAVLCRKMLRNKQ